MNILLGIGNRDRGDDGVGAYIADRFREPGWLCLNAGTAPENFTGIVRRHHPERLVLVDATEMGLAPGSVRRIPRDRIRDVGIGTHMLPLHHLMEYLRDCAGEIVLLGIQPKSAGFGDDLSPEVLRAAREVMEAVRADRLSSTPDLEAGPG